MGSGNVFFCTLKAKRTLLTVTLEILLLEEDWMIVSEIIDGPIWKKIKSIGGGQCIIS